MPYSELVHIHSATITLDSECGINPKFELHTGNMI